MTTLNRAKRFKIGDKLWWLHKNWESGKDRKVRVKIISVHDKCYRIKFEDKEITKLVPQEYFNRLTRQ